MPLVRLVPNAAASRLDSLTTLSFAVFDDTLTPSVLATDVDALAGEVTAGGYARATGVGVAWNATTQRLELDDPEPSFDLDGEPAVSYLVAFDPADDQVVSFLPFDGAPVVGFDGFTVELPDGVAGRGNEWPLQVAVDDHESRIAILESSSSGGGGGAPAGTTAAPLDLSGGGTTPVADLDSHLIATDVSVVLTLAAGTTEVTLDLPPASGARTLSILLDHPDSTPFDVLHPLWGPWFESLVGMHSVTLVVFGGGGGSTWLPAASWEMP